MNEDSQGSLGLPITPKGSLASKIWDPLVRGPFKDWSAPEWLNGLLLAC